MFNLSLRSARVRSQTDLVDSLKESEALRTEAIERAFRLVDRALFLPVGNARAQQPIAEVFAPSLQQPTVPPLDDSQQQQATGLRVPRATRAQIDAVKQLAYDDAPIKIGNLHISAPYTYATILERLAIKPGMSFLNLGSGSGFLSCLAAVLVGSSGVSHGVELRSDVVEHARRCTATWIRRIKRWKRQQQDLDEMEAEHSANAEAASSTSATAAAAVGSRKRKAEEEEKEESDADEEIETGSKMTDVPSSASSSFMEPAASATSASTPAAPSSLLALIAVPAGAAPSADPVGSPLPSPSPTPSVHSTSGESHSSEIGGAGASWTPDFPITTLPVVPQYIEGDVFDLARDEAAQKYDRVYIGASLPSKYLPVFAQLLHPGGRLVAAFGSSVQMVIKRHDGTLKVELLGNGGSGELILPNDADEATGDRGNAAAPASSSSTPPASAATATAATSSTAAPTTPPKPRLVFPRVAFQASDDYSSLPLAMREAMHAILMLQARDGAVSLPGRLPLPLWAHILGFCSRDDWLDRARGLVPWSIPPTDLLQQAQAQLNEAKEQAIAQKWRKADACLKDCNRLLELTREEVTFRAAAAEEAESTTGGAASPTPSPPVATLPSSASPLLARLQTLQRECWLAELSMLTHLSEHSRAICVATSLLERSGMVVQSNQYRALLAAKTQAQFRAGELSDALNTCQQLQDNINKRAEAESKGDSSSPAAAAAASSTSAPLFTPAFSFTVSLGSPVFGPLPVPSAADVAYLRSQLDSAFLAYRQREMTQRNRMLRFMAGAFMTDAERATRRRRGTLRLKQSRV